MGLRGIKRTREGNHTRIGNVEVSEYLQTLVTELQKSLEEALNWSDTCPIKKKVLEAIKNVQDLEILNTFTFGQCLENCKGCTHVILYLIRNGIISNEDIKLKYVLLPSLPSMAKSTHKDRTEQSIAYEIIGIDSPHIFLIVESKDSKIILDPYFYWKINLRELEEMEDFDNISWEVKIVGGS